MGACVWCAYVSEWLAAWLDRLPPDSLRRGVGAATLQIPALHEGHLMDLAEKLLALERRWWRILFESGLKPHRTADPRETWLTEHSSDSLGH